MNIKAMLLTLCASICAVFMLVVAACVLSNNEYNSKNNEHSFFYVFTNGLSANKAYRKLKKFFYVNREKYLLKRLKLVGPYNCIVEVKCKCIAGFDDIVDLRSFIEKEIIDG